MNKQTINKVKLFLMGLESRFNENKDIFKGIYVTYTAGLKEFKGTGQYKDEKISYNFGGKTELLAMAELCERLAELCAQYDSLSVLYRERGTALLISADNKNVKMTSTEVKDSDNDDPKAPSNSTHIAETSTLLNRDYYIKPGKADALLKEIGIMSKEGKIKNDKIRKYNQIDHYVELLEGIIDKLPSQETINVIDCGCGKSYLTFVLNYYLTEVKKKKCHFIGIDYSPAVIEASKKMANNLGYRNMEFHAMDIKDFTTNKKIHIVISLHACNTATDMALAFGVRLKSQVIIAVPCCQRELLNQYSYEPFKGILKHGILKARMADVLTDGMRALMLEAKGYDVSVVEYISPLETPKNLMIRAIRTGKENPAAMEEYVNLMSQLNVYSSLYQYINEIDMEQ